MLVMYFAFRVIINVSCAVLGILLGVKNISIQCHNILKFRVTFHDVLRQSATKQTWSSHMFIMILTSDR
jgi:hypothetical protein